MATVLPASVNFGTVRLESFRVGPDGPDPDADPDTTASNGTVTLVPSVPYVTVGNLLVQLDNIILTLDENGFAEAKVVSNLDPDISPNGWTYRVEFNLSGTTISSFSINVPVEGVVNLGAAIHENLAAQPSVVTVVDTTLRGQVYAARDAAEAARAAAVAAAGGGVTSGSVIPSTGMLRLTRVNGTTQDIAGVVTRDTGWRSVPWFMSGVTGTMRVRRIGNLVNLLIQTQTARDVAVEPRVFRATQTLTPGFEAATGFASMMMSAYASASQYSLPTAVPVWEYGSGAIAAHFPTPGSNTLYIAASWITDAAWPTTLPGTAV